MDPLEKICEILGLQRKNLERQIAALDIQIKHLDAQLVDINAAKTSMTEAVYAGEVSDNVIQDSITLELWKGKLASNVLSLEKQKRNLQAAKVPLTAQLAGIIARFDILTKKNRDERKKKDDLYAEAQTSERLETWVNKHIL